MKSVSLLPLLLLWIFVIGQSLGNNAADLSSLEKYTSPLPATSEGHTKEGVDIQKRVTVDDVSVLDLSSIPTDAHEQVEFDKINSGHGSLQDNTSSTESEGVYFLSETPNGLKHWTVKLDVSEVLNAALSTIQNVKSFGAKYLTSQPIEDLLAEISNVVKDCTAKVDVSEVFNAALSNIQNGFNSVKGLGAKCFVLDMSNISTIANRIMVALTVACVMVLLPRLSIQLLLSLAVGCLYLRFACRRCGELFRALRQRRDPNGIAQDGRGNPPPIVRLIYDTARLVYEDTRRWHRNNWKRLNDAVDSHLLRFCSPQRDPPVRVRVESPQAQGILVPGPAMNHRDVHREAVGVDAELDPFAAQAAIDVAEEPADGAEAVGVDAASDPSAALATTAAVVASAPPLQELFRTYGTHSSASVMRSTCRDVCIVCTSIDDVCSRIKEGLGPVYAQLMPFSPPYFRLQRVVECNMRSLVDATRGLDWTNWIDPLVVDMVTVVAVEQSNEDVDAIFNNGVLLVRLEVPSGNGGGKGNLCPSKLLQTWLKPLLKLLKAATPTLTSKGGSGSASENRDTGSSTKNSATAENKVGKVASTRTAGSASEIRGARRPKKNPMTTENKSDESASAKTNDGASENGDAGSSTETSAATDNRSDAWFVASVSELSDLNATKVSFDALHRLLEFALWPWAQKASFLFELAGMIAVDRKSPGHAFLVALDHDLAEREKLCIFPWRVELFGGIWKEKSLVYIENSKSNRPLNDEELAPYRDQVGLLNKLWAEHKGGFSFESLPLRVLRAIRNMDAHKDEKSVFVLKPEMWRLVDTLFPSLFPVVAGAVVHKLSELHRQSELLLTGGERWFLEHGTGAWTNAQCHRCERCTMSPSIGDLLNAVQEARAAKYSLVSQLPK